jgi:hypothetical protein
VEDSSLLCFWLGRQDKKGAMAEESLGGNCLHFLRQAPSPYDRMDVSEASFVPIGSAFESYLIQVFTKFIIRKNFYILWGVLKWKLKRILLFFSWSGDQGV